MAHPIPELSVGNQRRAQLAIALAAHPAVLVIDEPTNYLDLQTMKALEDALHKWHGTLIVASHDRWLIEHWDGQDVNLQPAWGQPRSKMEEPFLDVKVVVSLTAMVAWLIRLPDSPRYVLGIY